MRETSLKWMAPQLVAGLSCLAGCAEPIDVNLPRPAAAVETAGTLSTVQYQSEGGDWETAVLNSPEAHIWRPTAEDVAEDAATPYRNRRGAGDESADDESSGDESINNDGSAEFDAAESEYSEPEPADNDELPSGASAASETEMLLAPSAAADGELGTDPAASEQDAAAGVAVPSASETQDPSASQVETPAAVEAETPAAVEAETPAADPTDTEAPQPALAEEEQAPAEPATRESMEQAEAESSGSSRPYDRDRGGAGQEPESPPEPTQGPTPSQGSESANIWQPAVGSTWDWQLSTPVDYSADYDVYMVDMEFNSAETIQAIKTAGGRIARAADYRRVVCYVNVGALEDFRGDAERFPASVLGEAYSGFPRERWLDIRQLDVIGPLMLARFKQAQAKGCDGVEPDNMDGYDTTAHESTGFPLSYEDQLRYNLWIADEVHALGMAVGVKNNINQVAELADVYDFALSEECATYDECDFFDAFIERDKAVFLTEYALTTAEFCPVAQAHQFSAIRKTEALDSSYREDCKSYP